MWKYCNNNKYHNIFTKNLFSVVVSYSLIFHYFISTNKKFDTLIIVKILWNLLCQYNNIYANLYKYFFKKRHKLMTEKTNKKNIKKFQWSDEQYILRKLKSIVTFTHSHNKCYNIFTKHIFLVVVNHSLIFYYFISTYKKLTPQ